MYSDDDDDDNDDNDDNDGNDDYNYTNNNDDDDNCLIYVCRPLCSLIQNFWVFVHAWGRFAL